MKLWIFLAFVAVTTGVIVGVSLGAAIAKNTDNDKVLRGDRAEYTEYFKQDASGGKKNYLYTRTELSAPPVGKCVVVTGASEQTIAIYCNTGQG